MSLERLKLKDHVHLLVKVSSKENLLALVRTLKCVSAKEIKQYLPMPKQKELHFWARRYGCREIRKSEIKGIREYVRNQKKHPTLPRGE